MRECESIGLKWCPIYMSIDTSYLVAVRWCGMQYRWRSFCAVFTCIQRFHLV